MWGHQVEVAEDGPRGFEMALAGRPDIVVVDIALPGVNGYHVAQGVVICVKHIATSSVFFRSLQALTLAIVIEEPL